MGDATKPFATVSNRAQIREILSSVYDSLMLKGYNPINQLVGYILSEDPTYITNYNNARSLICRIDRDELRRSWCAAISRIRNKPIETNRAAGELSGGSCV